MFDGTDLGLLDGEGQTLKRTLFASSAALISGALTLMGYWLVQAVNLGAYEAPLTSAGIGALLFVMGVFLSLFALGRISEEEQKLRRQVQIIFQDPYASLNPRRTVEQTIVEPMTVHQIGSSHKERVAMAGTYWKK